ncbi:Long chronological lifespan protein 2 [Fusarium oligoseptatum]|uniref:Long chronological lifespan protein 2 n=1 Tax=Fusarium oligoseptatum TaxID=2604345 RepID=A0A428TUD0_9HYPO|nr:Long chronological lifespan protein 2 [Fusarium oligoseptatum]
MRYLIAVLSLLGLANAQFGGFFDQMFGQQGGEQHHAQPQNNPSDASHYPVCDKYLCPDTLACVHFPHHCPCAWDAQQEKFELAEGQRICVSRGGFREEETARKLELARKGLL